MLPKIEQHVETTITRRYRVQVNREALVTLLRHTGIEVPSNAKISVHVPGGGDWSHTNLEIDNESPVNITWETDEMG
jgi:hypothetical protein